MECIISRQDPLITRLRRLGAGKKTRQAQGVFLCEGIKLVGKTLRWGPPLELPVVAEETAPLAELSVGVRVAEVPEALLRAVSAVETPRGMLAMCRAPGTTPPEALSKGRLLVSDGVQNLGSVGIVWRTADAFGMTGLFLLPGYAKPFAPKTVCATMGACSRLPVREGTLGDLAGPLVRSAVSLYTAALRDGTEDIHSVSLGNAAVVIGSEERGVSQPVLGACRAILKIPMRDRCEPLNTVVAASMVLWGGWR